MIGGGQQGEDDEVDNARIVIVGEGASVSSDGGAEGDGGRVIIFAEETAIVNGDISARGGDTSGNGGFVETSGLQYLHVEDAPDIRAPSGSGGTWLIDPYNIQIVDTNQTGNVSPSPGGSGADWVAAPTDTPSIINIFDISEVMSYGGNVTINTSNDNGTDELGNIDFVADFSMFTYNSSYDTGVLSLIADNNITLSGNISDQANSSLEINFSASNDIITTGDISVEGAITFDAGNDISINDSPLTASNISISAGNDVVSNGRLRGRTVYSYPAPPSGGEVTIEAGNNILVSDGVRGRNITLVADSDVSGAGTVEILNNGKYLSVSANETLSIYGAGVTIESSGSNFYNGIRLRGDDVNIGSSSNAISGDITIQSGADPLDSQLDRGGSIRIEAKYDLNIAADGDLTIESGASSYFADGVQTPNSIRNNISITSKYSQNIQADTISIITGAGRESGISIEANYRYGYDQDYNSYIDYNSGQQTITANNLTIDASDNDLYNVNTDTLETDLNTFYGSNVIISADINQTINVSGDLSVVGRVDTDIATNDFNNTFNSSIISFGDQAIDVGGTLTLDQSEILVSLLPDFSSSPANNPPVFGSGDGHENTITVGGLVANQGLIAFQQNQIEATTPSTLTFTNNGEGTINGPLTIPQPSGNDTSALSLQSVNFVQNGDLNWQSGEIELIQAEIPSNSFNTGGGDNPFPDSVLNDSTFTNNGSFRTNSETGRFVFTTSDSAGPVVNNTAGGTIIKDVGEGVTDFNVTINNAGDVIGESGTLDLDLGTLNQTDGQTILRGGSIQNNADGGAFVFTGGAIRGGVSESSGYTTGGSLISDVTVSNTEIDPGFSPGVLTIDGDFDASAGGNTFMIDVVDASSNGAGIAYDQLVITGDANITATGANGANNVVVNVDLPFADQSVPGNTDPLFVDSFNVINSQGGSIALLATDHQNVPADVNASESLSNGGAEFNLDYEQIVVEPPVVEPPVVEPPVVEPPVVEPPVVEPPVEPPVVEPPVVPPVVVTPPPPVVPPVVAPPVVEVPPEVIVVIIDEQPVALPPDIINVLVTLSDEERDAYLQSERVRDVLKTVNMCVGQT